MTRAATLIDAASLLPWRAYRDARRLLRPAMIAHRQRRSLRLGPAMRLQFEDETTVRHQLQEVLCAERIDDPAAVADEIALYAHLLPDARHWKATLMIELPDAAQREREMPRLSAAAHHVYLEAAGERIVASANDDLADRHGGRPSAVHFLRFELPAALRHIGATLPAVAIGCAHPDYPLRCAIPAQTLRDLLASHARPAHHAAEQPTDAIA